MEQTLRVSPTSLRSMRCWRHAVTRWRNSLWFLIRLGLAAGVPMRHTGNCLLGCGLYSLRECPLASCYKARKKKSPETRKRSPFLLHCPSGALSWWSITMPTGQAEMFLGSSTSITKQSKERWVWDWEVLDNWHMLYMWLCPWCCSVSLSYFSVLCQCLYWLL